MAQNHPPPPRYGTAGLVFLLGLALSVQVWHSAARHEADKIHAEFLRRAQAQASLARQRLLLDEEMVYSLRDAFFGQPAVTRTEFSRIATELLHRHPGVQALEWVVILPQAERAALEQNATLELGRPYAVKHRNPDGQFTIANDAGEYLPILYIEPMTGNEAALGYDLKSAPTLGAITQMRARRKLAVSGAFPLTQSAGPADEPGVVFILPVFKTTAEDSPVHGFVQAVFRVQTMLSQAHRLDSNEALESYYFDLDATPKTPSLLYVNLSGREPLRGSQPVAAPAWDDPADFHDTLTVGDRRWLLVIRADPAWIARQSTNFPGLLLAASITITALLASVFYQLLQRTARVEYEVALSSTKLRETETRFQAILDQDSSIIFLKDLAGRYIFVNQAYQNFFQLPPEKILLRTDQELFPAALAESYIQRDREIFTTGKSVEFEDTAMVLDVLHFSIVRKFPLRDRDGQIYALCGIATDITRFKQAEGEKMSIERQLLEARRLESLGVLAGGVAHDFNNILTAVLGNASLARLQLPRDHEATATLGQIEHAARRAADLCAQMLAYAGKGSYVADTVDLSALVRDTLALLEISVPKSTRIYLDLTSPLPAVQADGTQVRQIVMNLVLNAGDAIGQNAGDIRISTYVQEAKANFFRSAVRAPDLPPGRYIGLDVADNGSGMTPEVMAHIFEPFFTTKFSGRGLGLAAVLGIMQSHRGALFVESTPGRGTTFRLFLPATDLPPAPLSSPPMNRAEENPERLQGTVLVVDDEDSVRRVARHALTRAGARVLEASNGNDALRLVSENAQEINLILLDLTMPGVSGEETLGRLRLFNHQHRVIVMSGYSESETAQRCRRLGAVEFLPKPFEISTLLGVVKINLAP